jgi:hypothetical protein
MSGVKLARLIDPNDLHQTLCMLTIITNRTRNQCLSMTHVAVPSTWTLLCHWLSFSESQISQTAPSDSGRAKSRAKSQTNTKVLPYNTMKTAGSNNNRHNFFVFISMWDYPSPAENSPPSVLSGSQAPESGLARRKDGQIPRVARTIDERMLLGDQGSISRLVQATILAPAMCITVLLTMMGP